MKCVVGLGNPGKRYALTRHNVGYMVLAQLSHRFSLSFSDQGFAFTAQGLVSGRESGVPVLLVRPVTFMNLSGQAVSAVLREHSIDPLNLLVIHDDMDLPFGKIRLKRRGKSGGHKGIESIIAHLGTGDFARLKIGVGRPEDGVDPADYVLDSFFGHESHLLPEVLSLAADAACEFIAQGMDQAMERYNGKDLMDKSEDG